MFCKQLVALFLWCHCYQIVLNPLLQLLAFGLNNLNNGASGSTYSRYNNLGYYVSGSPITAAANKVTLTPGSEIVLRCNIAEYPEAQFTWFRRKVYPYESDGGEGKVEEAKEELSAKDDRYSISNNVMVIKSSMLADVGDYFCQVQGTFDGVAEREKMISVRPRPYIYEFELPASTPKSAVVEEGTALKISCNVADEYFSPDSINISWYMSKYDENDMNEVNSGEDGINVQTNNKTSSDLTIDRVTKDHRRLYKCQVSNGVTDNSKIILIRVKNKYTVIWPAVGILLELVILIGVICVVENRKVEPDRGAYDRKAIHQM